MNYGKASSIDEAISLLQNGRGKIIAGGTDLVLDLNEGRLTPETLVDITEIPELMQIREERESLFIGGAVTHRQAHESTLIKQYAPALSEGCGHVGSFQIRNVATIAGNVVNAQPAADSAVPLAVMNPTFLVRGQEGVRKLSMDEMYVGFGKSGLDSTREILTGILIDKEVKGEGSAYERLELRKALALPMLCVAARVHIDAGSIVWARIAMAPVGVGPVRAQAAEEYLAGKDYCSEVLEEAGRLALEDANPRSNLLRGSREYRMDTLPVIVRRALKRAGEIAEKRSA